MAVNRLAKSTTLNVDVGILEVVPLRMNARQHHAGGPIQPAAILQA
ncbi:hypothetical protein RE6C_02778 [Rhodopirellula europaea 6C]|uniref:Uncharacterized protein n=1 Tax=Rhodopirellula europaea 6C TaxID=1263867 RepID=M2B3T3_9BACT|nr:hypothetical protein RE6C_02778 [Rhodopirellula europaea 6C]